MFSDSLSCLAQPKSLRKENQNLCDSNIQLNGTIYIQLTIDESNSLEDFLSTKNINKMSSNKGTTSERSEISKTKSYMSPTKSWSSKIVNNTKIRRLSAILPTGL